MMYEKEIESKIQELPEDLDGFTKELIGEIELKGKKGKINLYSIEYSN